MKNQKRNSEILSKNGNEYYYKRGAKRGIEMK
jgi:hypothetical protein